MFYICFVRINLIILLQNIIFYILFAIYYRLCIVSQTAYLLAFGSKLHLLPKVNCLFLGRCMILNYTIQFGFHHLLPIAQFQ